MAQLMPLPPTVSCFSKIQMVLPLWYRLTWVVSGKDYTYLKIYIFKFLTVKKIHLYWWYYCSVSFVGYWDEVTSQLSCPKFCRFVCLVWTTEMTKIDVQSTKTLQKFKFGWSFIDSRCIYRRCFGRRFPILWVIMHMHRMMLVMAATCHFLFPELTCSLRGQVFTGVCEEVLCLWVSE